MFLPAHLSNPPVLYYENVYAFHSLVWSFCEVCAYENEWSMHFESQCLFKWLYIHVNSIYINDGLDNHLDWTAKINAARRDECIIHGMQVSIYTMTVK